MTDSNHPGPDCYCDWCNMTDGAPRPRKRNLTAAYKTQVRNRALATVRLRESTTLELGERVSLDMGTENTPRWPRQHLRKVRELRQVPITIRGLQAGHLRRVGR